MKQPSALVIVNLLLSVIPAYYGNRYLLKQIRPRENFGRLMLYMLSGFAFVFVYTFLVVKLILLLFPPHLK